MDFENLSVGDTIILFNGGRIANASGYSTTSKVTLELKLTNSGTNDAGLPVLRPYFEATWEGKVLNPDNVWVGP